MTAHTHTTDTVVVGLGAWGSQAMWRLATRGVDVIGVEQFDVGHALGSTHGTTRLFRELCLEHPGLTPVATRARELWRELGTGTGTELLSVGGGVMVGPPDGRVVSGVLAAAEAAGLPVERLPAAEVRSRFPVFGTLPDEHVAVLDPGAGIARPEAGVVAAVDAARGRGAQVLRGRVEAIDDRPDGVVVHLSGGATIAARQAVVTAGAWTARLVDLPLRPRRVPMFWFTGRGPAPLGADGAVALDRFPVFIRELDDGRRLWGHGADPAGGFGIKIGLDDDGSDELGFADADPDHLDRAIDLRRDIPALADAVATAFPDVDPTPRAVVACMYTRSPDGLFHVGRVPDRERVLVAAGDSGHGHKHAPAIGELLAQEALGEQPFTDTGFLAVGR